MVPKLNNTKWDVSNWTVEMKVAWQKKMFNLGYIWKNCSFCEVMHLSVPYYFVSKDGEIAYGYGGYYFEESPRTLLTWEDVFPETNLPSIFDNPKWVTAINTDSEVGLVKGKDYKVYKVEEDRYWVYNDVQSPHPVWYYKDRFHKVTYEDLLPEKGTSEGKEGSFEDLVFVQPQVYGASVPLKNLSSEQLNFILDYFNLRHPEERCTHFTCLRDGNKYFSYPLEVGNPNYNLSFNDIFKHKSEI